jgi:hypothetical protein
MAMVLGWGILCVLGVCLSWGLVVYLAGECVCGLFFDEVENDLAHANRVGLHGLEVACAGEDHDLGGAGNVCGDGFLFVDGGSGVVLRGDEQHWGVGRDVACSLEGGDVVSVGEEGQGGEPEAGVQGLGQGGGEVDPGTVADGSPEVWVNGFEDVAVWVSRYAMKKEPAIHVRPTAKRSRKARRSHFLRGLMGGVI